MSVYDEMDAATRDDLFVAAEQFERMTPDQLARFMEDLEHISPAYRPESDILMIMFGVDSDHGITGWEVKHERGVKDGEVAAAGEASSIETVQTIERGTWSGFGTTTLDLFYPPENPFEPRRVLQGIYNTLIHLIGADEQTLFVLTTPPTRRINICDSPDPGTDVFAQEGAEWDGPVVVSEEMRAPPEENHIPHLQRSELPEVLGEVDAELPMSRFQCDRQLVACERTPVNDRQEVQSFPVEQTEEYRDNLVIKDGDWARGVAVIRDDYAQSNEEWSISKVFHPECGPSVEAFESGTDDVSLFRSKGKDEVYFEGTIEYGLTPDPDDEIPYRPVYFEEISVVARRGEHGE